MSRWAILRAIMLAGAAVLMSPKHAAADTQCCAVCQDQISNFHGCDGCTITTLGSCGYGPDPTYCTCHLPDCTCGDPGGRGGCYDYWTCGC